MELHLDTETYNDVPIKNGAHRYAEDAEVLLVSRAWDNEPVEVFDLTDPACSYTLGDLRVEVDRAERVVIHNSAFDRIVLEKRGLYIPVDKIEDTMVEALRHSLPAALGQLCDVLKVPVDKAKDKDGKKLIQLFTKPRPKNQKLRRATRETHPDEWRRFIEYARLDVDAMRDVRSRLPRWNSSPLEVELWALDQRINDRGVAVDRELATAALRAFERASRSLAATTASLTDGALGSTTQRNKLLELLRGMGVSTQGLTKDDVAKLLDDPELPDEARALLEIRQQAAATSPSKYKALLEAASSDGRLRGTVQYCGASRTGRDAGRIFQPQNLPRTPDWFDGEVQELTVAAFKADCDDLLWENVSERCALAVRGCLVAAPGKKLVIADLSNIEGRVLAWLAGEQWKIEAFKAYDRKEGHDLYKVTAGRILGKDPADVTKEERGNQGKVPELAGGFGGGLGAYRKMGGAVFNAMSDDAIMEIVHGWREAHPATKAFWYDVEAACRRAIQNPGDSFSVRGLVQFDQRAGPDGVSYVRCKLPSGRYLSYRGMRIDGGQPCGTCPGNGVVMVGGFVEDGGTRAKYEVCPECDGNGRIGGTGQILYEGMNQYTRKWEWLETYYGKLVENIVQAVARDVFFAGMVRAEAAGYRVVLRVHDELVCEVPDTPDFTHKDLAGFMATNPSWTLGLPLSAAGFEAYRYRKE